MRYIIYLIIAFSLLIPPVHATEPFLSAQVKDISDRNYETSVTELLDSAKKSITISMYTINVTEHKKNPINKLLDSLLQARKRGVLVELYLNTNFRDIDENKGLLITHPAC
jgi:phosphatidylserine/phosphatidylglycerophosphate/cardiolipin synthase-like enzyme